ncbi:MAG: RyR domain-containing protein [Candidatus Bipolaricaulia bacterium]
MTYEPKPIDTSGMKLPKGLRKLTELLAENNHDLWAQQRIAAGWTYGPQQDDANKKHPDLLPYAQLSESEKEYDRITAMEVLKTIIALGYRIESPSRRSSSASGSSYEAVTEALERLKGPDKLDLTDLLSIWAPISSGHWAGSSELYEVLGNRILKAGEPLLAYDIIATGLKHWPKNVRLRQLKGLALARSGAIERANEILSQLHHEGHTDGETLGLLARTHKDLREQATDPAEREAQLRQAHDIYSKAYRLAVRGNKVDDAIYTGINAATTALLMGQQEHAKELARKVRVLCLEKLQEQDDYWAEASLGEAAIILGEWIEAEARYIRAAEQGQGNYADLGSTRHNARLLMEYLGGDKHRFDRCFGIPRIVVFAGHMIDQPGRPRPRFPQSLEKLVRQEIAARLKKLDARIGYASAACGSDILFLEAMLRQKGEIHVVLPFPKDEFQTASVDIIPGANWGRRFRRVLKQVARVMVASEHRASGSAVAYEYSNLMQDGLAALRAQMLDTEVIPLVVWDGRPGDGPGGTTSLVEHWRSQDREPEVVDIATLLEKTIVIQSAPVTSKPATPTVPYLITTPPGFPQEIMAMLFADVVGYSKLTEEEIPRFVAHFMGAVSDLVAASPHKPVMKNTWGDALYFVFSSVKQAGNFALELSDWLRSTDWMEKGLPEDLNLRIALHAGPVYSCKDPVIEQHSYTGSHVNWAARIEPITPPGHVYASQPFAALAAAERISDFTCDYVGQTPLAKGYGTFPTYHVHRNP